MFLWLPISPQVHLDFNAKPEAEQISRGAAIEKRGAGVDRTLLDDRRVGATWFDGRIRRPSDTITWVSPSLTARWLGFLAAQDGWSDADLAHRWAAAETTLRGRLTFVVRLAAMPKVDSLDFGTGSPARPAELENVKFAIRWEDIPNGQKPGEWHVTPGIGVKTAEIQKYDSAPILNRQFFELTPLAPLFLDHTLTNEPDDGILLGDRFSVVYVVTFPIEPTMDSATTFELDVIREQRPERVRFAGATPPKASKKSGRQS